MYTIVSHIFHSRHFWRHVAFGELTELYISMTTKTLSLSLIGIFVPVYLYQQGYTLADIAAFYVIAYGVRIVLDILTGYLVDAIGPKHAIIASYLFLAMELMFLMTIPSHLWAPWLIGLINAVASSLFFVAYHVDFSKIKHSDTEGAELGRLFRLQRIASAAGPLLGGLIATFFDIKLTIFIAIVLIIIGAIPMLSTPEPVHRQRSIRYRDLPFRKLWRDYVSNLGLGVDQMVTVYLWPLYVSIFVFSDDVYLAVGLVTSLGLSISLLVTRTFGRIIDAGHGSSLLNTSAALQAIMHSMRLLVVSPIQVLLFNLINDPLQVGIRMPYTKGTYDRADTLRNHRIVYICSMLSSLNVVRASLWLVVFILSQSAGNELALQATFVLSSISVLGAVSQRFPTLRRVVSSGH